MPPDGCQRELVGVVGFAQVDSYPSGEVRKLLIHDLKCLSPVGERRLRQTLATLGVSLVRVQGARPAPVE